MMLCNFNPFGIISDVLDRKAGKNRNSNITFGKKWHWKFLLQGHNFKKFSKKYSELKG